MRSQYLSSQSPVVLVLLLSCGCLSAQSSLTLSTPVANGNGGVSYALSLVSTGGVRPAALQWRFDLPAGMGAVSSVPGPAVTAANKTLACNTVGQTYICVAYGMSQQTVPDGVVAMLTAPATGTVGLSHTLGADLAGNAVTVAAVIAQTPPATISGLACLPATLGPSSSATCTITLSSAAPAGGSAVAVSASSGLVTVPPTVTVAPGAASALFSATAGSILTDSTATLTATLNGSAATANLSLVAPIVVTSLACTPSTVTAGSVSNCMAALSKQAPSGGSAVALSSSAPSVIVPASASAQTGASSASFVATIGSISGTVTLTASMNGSSVSTALLASAPIQVSALQCAPASLGPNMTTTCAVSLSQAAPDGGTVVAISATSAILKVPSSLTIGAGTATASFAAAAGAFSADTTASISASLNGGTASASVTMLYRLVSMTFQTGLQGYKGGQDNMISSASPDSTYKSSGPVFPDRVSAKFCTAPCENILLRFQNLGITGTIVGAQLQLKESAQQGGSSFLFAGKISRPDWDTNTVTWNSYKAGATWTAAGGDYGLPVGQLAAPGPGWVTIDLGTNFTAAELQQNGIMITTNVPGSNAIWFYSNSTANPADRPALVVRFLRAASPVKSPSFLDADGDALADGARAPITNMDGRPAALQCDPGLVRPGSKVVCELRLVQPAHEGAAPVAILSSSTLVKVPWQLTPVPGQQRIRFETFVDRKAPAGAVSLEAMAAGDSVKEFLTILAGSERRLAIEGERIGAVGSVIQLAVALPGRADIALRAAASPPGAQFDSETGLFRWIPEEEDVGLHKTVFRAADGGIDASETVAIRVVPRRPVIDELQNAAAASARAACSPGAPASLIGSSFVPETKVLVNGSYAQVIRASWDRVDFICPGEPAGTDLSITVETRLGKSSTFRTVMAAAAPGLFTVAGAPGSMTASAYQGSLTNIAALPNFWLDARPAAAGGSLTLLATGIACGSGPRVDPPAVLVGGLYAKVVSLEAATETGRCAITVTLPGGIAGDEVPVVLETLDPAGRRVESNQAMVAIERRE
jgi:uncharacterized protein (TIGR03437 family)